MLVTYFLGIFYPYFCVPLWKLSEMQCVGLKTALAPAHFIPIKGSVLAAFLSRVFQLAGEVSCLQLKQQQAW